MKKTLFGLGAVLVLVSGIAAAHYTTPGTRYYDAYHNHTHRNNVQDNFAHYNHSDVYSSHYGNDTYNRYDRVNTGYVNYNGTYGSGVNVIVRPSPIVVAPRTQHSQSTRRYTNTNTNRGYTTNRVTTIKPTTTYTRNTYTTNRHYPTGQRLLNTPVRQVQPSTGTYNWAYAPTVYRTVPVSYAGHPAQQRNMYSYTNYAR